MRTGTLKFLCSYGGKIRFRQTDGKLRYVGGLTRVLAVDRSVSYSGSYVVNLFPFFVLFWCSLYSLNRFLFRCLRLRFRYVLQS